MRCLASLYWRLTCFPFREVIVENGQALGAARTLVRAHYAVMLYISLNLYLDSSLASKPNYVELLWPVKWIALLDWQSTVSAITLGLVCTSLLALFFPTVRACRFLVFLFLFEYIAIDNSYGKMNHGLYLPLFATLALVFLPSLQSTSDKAGMRNYLAGIFGVQTLLMTTYTLAGLQKIWGALIDLTEDGVTFLHPDALALHIVSVTQGVSTPTPLGGILLDYSLLGMPLMLGAVFLEGTALIAMFRPRLHVLYGASLILMHLGIYAAMGISFAMGVLIVGIWIVGSPFAHPKFNLLATVRDIPWFGPLAATLWAMLGRSTSRESIIFYDSDCGMCDRFVYFCIRHGLPGGVTFASLQGTTYAALKANHPYLEGIDSSVIYTRESGAEYIRVKSEAALWMLSQLNGLCRFAVLLLLVPVPLLDIFYSIIARFRKRFFPNVNQCALLPPEQRKLFLD